MKNYAVSGKQTGLVIDSGLKAHQAKLFTIFASLSLNVMRFLGGDKEIASPIEITSPFGWRTHPILGNLDFHQRIDFAAAEGSPVLAASGLIGMGVMEIFVEPEEMVVRGQVIGFEYRELTPEGWVAINPSSWLDHQMTGGKFCPNTRGGSNIQHQIQRAN